MARELNKDISLWEFSYHDMASRWFEVHVTSNQVIAAQHRPQ